MRLCTTLQLSWRAGIMSDNKTCDYENIHVNQCESENIQGPFYNCVIVIA